MKKRNKLNSGIQARQSGYFIPLLGVLIVGIIAILGLGIGTGVRVSARNNTSEVAKLANLSFLSGYLTTEGSVDDKISAGLQKANYFLSENAISNSSGHLDPLEHADVEIGHYYLGPLAESNEDPCSGDYPCFLSLLPEDASPNSVNAARVTVKGVEHRENIFSKFIGNQESEITEKNLSYRAKTCAGFLIDVSMSTSYDSHRAGPFIGIDTTAFPPQLDDQFASLPVFLGEDIPKTDPDDPSTFCDPDAEWNIASPFFCRMPQDRSMLNCNPTASHYQRHFQDDLNARVVSWNNSSHAREPIWPNTFLGPQNKYVLSAPLSYFFQGANAGAQYLNDFAVAGDSVRAFAFARDLRRAYPNTFLGFSASTSFTSNYDLLAQITDLTNLGLTDCDRNTVVGHEEVRPNSLDLLWLPFLSGENLHDNTNLITPLSEMAKKMDQNCERGSTKVIFLFSDGISTCEKVNSTSVKCEENDFESMESAYERLQRGYLQLVDPNVQYSVMAELRKKGVSVYTIGAGKHIRPNHLNIKEGERFLTQEEAIYRGVDWVSAENSPSAGADVLSQLGNGAVYLGEANKVLFDLAKNSGGHYCPLRPLCSDIVCGGSCYENDPDHPDGPRKLKRIYRDTYPVQTCALYELSLGEQAASCVTNALKNVRYVSVE